MANPFLLFARRICMSIMPTKGSKIWHSVTAAGVGIFGVGIFVGCAAGVGIFVGCALYWGLLLLLFVGV